MRQFSKAVASAVLLVLLGVPAMACLAPNAQLTQEEAACCRKMASQCGSRGMPGNHSCCQKAIQQHDAAVVKDATHVSCPHSVAQVATVQMALSSAPSIASAIPFESLRHPPPQPASPSVEILRI